MNEEIKNKVIQVITDAGFEVDDFLKINMHNGLDALTVAKALSEAFNRKFMISHCDDVEDIVRYHFPS